MGTETFAVADLPPLPGSVQAPSIFEHAPPEHLCGQLRRVITRTPRCEYLAVSAKGYGDVVLSLSHGALSMYIELSPTVARALAAELVASADAEEEV